MPHIIIKHRPGPSEQQKERLVADLVKKVARAFGVDEGALTVALEEVKPEDWLDQVYRPEVVRKIERLYKKPGYRLSGRFPAASFRG
jgi:4-oxalocrotonate tautomerase